MTSGRWNAPLPTRTPLNTVPIPPAPSSWRTRYFKMAALYSSRLRLLGLDVGDARIGVALSDETATLATGRPTITRVGPRRDVKAVAALVRDEGVAEVVVGLPRRLDRTLGPQAEKVQTFMEALRRSLRVPVHAWDER